MKIALDVDSTLAGTQITALDHLEDGEEELTYEDVESWDWGLERYGADEYLGALHNAWVYDVEDIPPMEDGLPETVSAMRDNFEVHIVTHQPEDDRISEGKIEWLEANGIEYDAFSPVNRDTPKSELDYDVYIDDKPTLPGRVTDGRVFLRDHPYNRNAEGSYTRVNTVSEALIHLETDFLAERVENTIARNRERMREMGVTPPSERSVSGSSTQELLQETHEVLRNS